MCCNASNTNRRVPCGGTPPPTSETVYDVQGDSTLEVCFRALSSHLAVAHCTGTNKVLTRGAYRLLQAFATKQEGRWNLGRWVEVVEKDSHVLPGGLWMDPHL